MKARFKSEEAREMFIAEGAEIWAFGSGRPSSNNNLQIAEKVGMNEFDVIPAVGPFPGWFDIIIDGEFFDSIASNEMVFFDFYE